MKRRDFLTGVGLAGAGGAFAAPAVAQSAPSVTWRLTSSFPTMLDTIWSGAQTFAQAVREMTDGRFTIELHPAGEIVPPLQALDAVKSGKADCAQTALFYHWGMQPALVFATGVPFGMNAREQNAFFRYGGGTDLVNELLVDHGLFALPAGNTGCQMGGWFRNELRSVADLRGLRFRVSGLAGKMLTRLGVIPTAASRAQIVGAFESGALDAAGWVSPVDDEKLSLTRVAPWYYYPGWWQGSMAIHLTFDLAKWSALPKGYQSVVRAAAELANADVLARYDTLNPVAVRRLVEAGAKLRAFPQDILEACWQASIAEFRDASAADPTFQRVHDAYMRFRNEQYVWWQVAEYPYDNFIIRQRAKG